MPLKDVKCATRNPKKHDIPRLVKSIQRFGFIVPPVVNELTGCLVAGHGRIEALRKMQSESKEIPQGIRVTDDGDWCIPMVTGEFKDDKEAAAYLLADNKIGELGGWDVSELSEMFKELEDNSLDDLGFMHREVEKTFKAVQEASLDTVMKKVNTKKTVKQPAWLVVRFDQSAIPNIEKALDDFTKVIQGNDIKVEKSY